MNNHENLRKVKEILERGNINVTEAISFLSSLIESSNDDDFRGECIKSLGYLAPNSERIYNLLENYLISDNNPRIRVLVIRQLVNNYGSRSIKPLLWVINNEKSPLVLSELFEITERNFKDEFKEIYEKIISKLSSFAMNLGIPIKEFKFILDIEAMLTKNNVDYEVDDETLSFYSQLTKIGDHPWLSIKNNHIEQLRFNYFNWKFLRESTEVLDSISRLELLDLFLNIIKKYDIPDDSLRKIPESIGNLSELRVLDLSYNNFGELPKSVVKLKELRVLDVSHNTLKSLPDLSKLKELQEVDLSYNQFREIPEFIKNMTPSVKFKLIKNPIE